MSQTWNTFCNALGWCGSRTSRGPPAVTVLNVYSNCWVEVMLASMNAPVKSNVMANTTPDGNLTFFYYSLRSSELMGNGKNLGELRIYLVQAAQVRESFVPNITSHRAL
eukprot:1547696-Amphidinium_carterae.1